MAIYTKKLYQTNSDVSSYQNEESTTINPLNLYVESFSQPSGSYILSKRLNIYLTEVWNDNGTTNPVYMSTPFSIDDINKGSLRYEDVNKYTSYDIPNIATLYILETWQSYYDRSARITIAGKDSDNPAYLEIQYALGNEPSQPTNFIGIQNGNNIDVSFDYVSSGQSGDVMTEYELQYRIDANDWQTVNITGTNTSYTLDGSLFYGVIGTSSVSARVRTTNNLGGTSEWTEVIYVDYVSNNPYYPSNVNAVQSSGNVNVAWDFETTPEGFDSQTGADIQYSFNNTDWSTLSYTGSNETYTISESYLNSTSVTERTIYFRVRTKNNLGGVSAYSGSTQINYKTSKPIPPTDLVPFEGQLEPPVTALWQFQDTGRGDSQASYEIQYKCEGQSTYTTVSGITSTHTFNNLLAGTVTWKVRVKSSTGAWSDYSEEVSFVYAVKPNNPVITNNNVFDMGKPLFAWTSDGQTAYRLQILKSSTVIHDTGEVTSTELELVSPMTLESNTVYVIKLQTKNRFELWSNWTQKTIKINPVVTDLQPFGQQVENVVTASWDFNNISEYPQTGFELQYKCEDQEWITKTGTTSRQYTFSNLIAGTVLWKVRIQTSIGLWSDWSTEASFIYAVPPSNPIITSATQFDISKPTLKWTSAGQISFRIQIYNDGNLYFDTQEVFSSATFYELEKALENNTTYTVRLRIKNRFALWSDWVEQSIFTSFKEPNQPSFSIVTDSKRASVHIRVKNPVISEISRNEILRKQWDETEWQVIGETIVNGTFVDYTPTTNLQYEYKVRATTSDGGYKDSDIQNTFVKVKNTQLANILDFNDWVELTYNPSKNFGKSYNKKLVHYVGREKPVTITNLETTWKMK